MGIYNPDPFLTSTDRELLRLLSQLVLEQELGWTGNRNDDVVELTDGESRLLLDLLEEFIDTKRFQESAYFIESIFSGEVYEDRRLREIFLSWRKFHRRSRAVATVQWQEFLMRLGAIQSTAADTRYWYRPSARPMTLDYFYRMEAKLADAADIHPRVKELLLAYVRLNFEYVGKVRSGERNLRRGQVGRKPKELIASLQSEQGNRVGQTPIPTTKIAAVMTIVMDLGCLYTTRDWSVAGFLSTIAGAAPPALLD